jgi:hypothetical protein
MIAERYSPRRGICYRCSLNQQHSVRLQLSFALSSSGTAKYINWQGGLEYS